MKTHVLQVRVSKYGLRSFGWVLASLLLCVVSGCGEQRAGPVDAELARQSLTEFLETWKRGGAIDELQKGDPKIVGQEILWQSGNKLKEYQLKDQGRIEDANMFCEVDLTLVDAQGNSKKKTVTYVIGTDPVITVFHAIL